MPFDSSEIKSLSFSGDGKYLAVACDDASIVVVSSASLVHEALSHGCGFYWHRWNAIVESPFLK